MNYRELNRGCLVYFLALWILSVTIIYGMIRAGLAIYDFLRGL